MTTCMLKKFIIQAIILAVAFNAFASTPQPPAVPRDYVTDLAGIVRGDVKNRLNASLQELERKTSAQVLVLTVQSLDGQSIEEFSFNTKEKWRLGQKRKDNGMLIVVAVKDRKYRFETGYGLENILPDSLLGSIGREYFIPYFRQGDYSTGIAAATTAVMQAIAKHEGVQLTDMPGVAARREGKEQGIPLNTILLALFLFGPILAGFLSLMRAKQGRRRYSGGPWGSGGYYGSSYGGFGGGGFGGFDGGSFGGGGGGSGGGGGASGGW